MRRVRASERQSLNQPSSRAKPPSPVPFKIVSIPPRPTATKKTAGRVTPKRSLKAQTAESKDAALESSTTMT